MDRKGVLEAPDRLRFREITPRAAETAYVLIEGTPKGSTRWIDTGWAIAAWKLVRGAGRA